MITTSGKSDSFNPIAPEYTALQQSDGVLVDAIRLVQETLGPEAVMRSERVKELAERSALGWGRFLGIPEISAEEILTTTMSEMSQTGSVQFEADDVLV